MAILVETHHRLIVRPRRDVGQQVPFVRVARGERIRVSGLNVDCNGMDAVAVPSPEAGIAERKLAAPIGYGGGHVVDHAHVVIRHGRYSRRLDPRREREIGERIVLGTGHVHVVVGPIQQQGAAIAAVRADGGAVGEGAIVAVASDVHRPEVEGVVGYEVLGQSRHVSGRPDHDRRRRGPRGHEVGVDCTAGLGLDLVAARRGECVRAGGAAPVGHRTVAPVEAVLHVVSRAVGRPAGGEGQRGTGLARPRAGRGRGHGEGLDIGVGVAADGGSPTRRKHHHIPRGRICCRPRGDHNLGGTVIGDNGRCNAAQGDIGHIAIAEIAAADRHRVATGQRAERRHHPRRVTAFVNRGLDAAAVVAPDGVEFAVHARCCQKTARRRQIAHTHPPPGRFKGIVLKYRRLVAAAIESTGGVDLAVHACPCQVGPWRGQVAHAQPPLCRLQGIVHIHGGLVDAVVPRDGVELAVQACRRQTRPRRGEVAHAAPALRRL